MMHTQDPRRWLFTRYRILLAPILLVSALSAVMGVSAVLFAFFSKQVLDAAVAADERLFVAAAVTLLVLLVIQILAKLSHNYLKARFEKRADLSLTRALYERVLEAKLPAVEREHSGTLMNYLQSDVRTISEGLLGIVPRAVFLSLRFLLAVGFLLYLDARFAGVFLAVGILAIGFSLLIRRAIKERHNTAQDAEAHVRRHMQENLTHLPLIKAFEAETHTLDELVRRQRGYFGAFLRKKRLTVGAGTAFAAFFAFAYAAALVYGGYQIAVGVLTFGSLVAILQLLEHVQSPFSGFSTLIPRYYAMLASAERLMRIERFDRETKTPREPFAFHVLRFEAVDFAYERSPVLENFTLAVRPGEIVHLAGPSGIGKTTLLKLLLALEEPSSGRIYFETESGEVPLSPSTRPMFAYVPQDHAVQSGTIRETLTYNLESVHEDDLREACRAAAVLETIDRLPEGFETDLGEGGLGLSEGQRQRLAIARGLLRGAPILLLDEVTSALDEKTERAVLDNLAALEGRTCFVVSHRPLSDSLIDRRVTL